jgi:hypothetical protein
MMIMKRLSGIILLLVVIFPSIVKSQQTTQPDSLLDKMAGRWILTGIIDEKKITHDIYVKRVLEGQYVQIEEVSREKDAKGNLDYNALVYMCWQDSKKEYQCLWLDNTSNEGTSNGILGRAKQNGDKIELLFKFSDTVLFHTTFFYDRTVDTWQWTMDSEENGKLQPFARAKMIRNKE